MPELKTATTATTSNDFPIPQEVGLTPVNEAARDGKADQSGEGGEVSEGRREPEEALETHEVVEINKFTERKEWIEEKIKVLESIPPVEVFAAIEALSEEIPPGLSTCLQLNHWLEEHDRIEKETEIFDAEDMSKLKKLTKAATRRNLSPEDTDLIELTLTTLLALGKLLHLLRDRSESLDLLGLRLTWEEQRVTAWKERHSIVSDLEVFLSTRARWSLDTYELQPSTPSPSATLRFKSPSPSPSPRPSSSLARRRGSASSFNSISSDTSSIIGPSSVFSRSTRYKLAEMLSHDAAIFSGRVTALNHSKVMAAGKTLDKLIDASRKASRKPVPDEILDEQDRLEDKAIKELETVGKFSMAVVMQWKRADEHYSDIMKDQSAAQALITEINNAELQHPTTRHDAAFMSRTQALTKRLAVKGDPSHPRSSFPRPVHPLFPNQAESNQMIIKTLSHELSEAVKLARQAEVAAQAYHARLEAVKWAEMLKGQIQDISKQFEKVMNKLVHGVHDGNDHGDASPPDLSWPECLTPTRHGTFLALLPSVLEEFDRADQGAKRALRDGMAASMRLKVLPGIDTTLKNNMGVAMQELEDRGDMTRRTKEDVLARTIRLKEARRLWDLLIGIMDNVEDVKKLAFHGMEAQRWKVSEGRRNDMPITPDPDSPQLSQVSLPLPMTTHTALQRLDTLRHQLFSEFKAPLALLLPSLEQPLSVHLASSSDGLGKYIEDIQGLGRLWDGILQQAETMMAVQQDGRELGHNVDALQNDVDDAREGILNGNESQEGSAALESDLNSRTLKLQGSVRTFTDSLAARMLFVSRSDTIRVSYSASRSGSNFPASSENKLNRLKEPPKITLPFDLSALDNDVRAEGNALALRLAGGMQSLAKKLDYLRLSRLARIVDLSIEDLARNVDGSGQALSDLNASFESLPCVANQSGIDAVLSNQLAVMLDKFDQFAQDYEALVTRLTPPMVQSLRALQAAPGSHDSPIHGTVVLPRVKTSEDVLHRVDSVGGIISQLKVRIIEAKGEEETRLCLEKERLEADERIRIETERLKAEKEKEEELRLKAEEKARVEKEAIDAARRAEIEAAMARDREELSIDGKSTAETDSKERLDAEEGLSSVEMTTQASAKPKTPNEDVFGRLLSPSTSSARTLSPLMVDLRSRIVALRTRLQSLSFSTLIRSPPGHDGNTLPSSEQATGTRTTFAAIVNDAETLPAAVDEDAVIDSELRSFRSELDVARGKIQRLLHLGEVCDKVAACDHALSDLLEHADTYPAAPLATHLASPHISDAHLPCEEQLASRMAFTKIAMERMNQACIAVVDDARVVAEQTRVQQTWLELADMCTDRINGTRSRPSSSVSSTGRSSGGVSGTLSLSQKGKPSLNGHRTALHPRHSESSARRSISIAHDPIGRAPTHVSTRSVSGPSGSSSLFNTTFASRQRTSSLASIQSAIVSPLKRPTSPDFKSRLSSKRPGSPAFSEMSSRSVVSTPSRSTWSRAPRQSFGSVPRAFPTHDAPPKRKAYIANPKSKLDVAVGNVINNFRLPVTIQAVGDDWKDQSGKYWIGDAEPKLCFCRILRSQTVMVRVGGGWCELSKFLRGHFAELLAELPPSPPRNEERWINATTVHEAMASPALVARSPSTPEPTPQPLLPSLQISTPNGTSPQSLKTSSSPGDGSPLLSPFKFMRRADVGLRPGSPSPTRTRTMPATPAVTPTRTNIWRP